MESLIPIALSRTVSGCGRLVRFVQRNRRSNLQRPDKFQLEMKGFSNVTLRSDWQNGLGTADVLVTRLISFSFTTKTMGSHES